MLLSVSAPAPGRPQGCGERFLSESDGHRPRQWTRTSQEPIAAPVAAAAAVGLWQIRLRTAAVAVGLWQITPAPRLRTAAAAAADRRLGSCASWAVLRGARPQRGACRSQRPSPLADGPLEPGQVAPTAGAEVAPLRHATDLPRSHAMRPAAARAAAPSAPVVTPEPSEVLLRPSSPSINKTASALPDQSGGGLECSLCEVRGASAASCLSLCLIHMSR